MNKYICEIRKAIEYIVASDADSRYWHRLANKELEESLSHHWNVKKAKNVILFVGDGMSPDTITASRIYRDGETSRLAWEHFPHIGILKVLIGFLLDVILINMFYIRSSCTNVSFADNADLQHEQTSP